MTLKLSRKFYEALGEDVTNEFVDALNSVDAAYRSDLRDIIDQRFTQLKTELDARFTQFETKVEARLTTLHADLDIKWTERWTALDAKFDRNLERLKSELLRWMFGFWVSTLIGLGALFLRR
ncbi:MAG: hypothetical protein WD773_05070 [Gemmatimonadales bacterium]